MKRTHLLTKRLDVNKDDRSQVMCWGDVHFGAETCDIDFAKENLKQCIERKIYVLGMGDLLESAIVGSVGDLFGQKATPQEQMDYIIDILTPVVEAGLLLGLHSGNHCDRITKTTGINVMQIICRELHVPYLDHAAFHIWYVGGESYTAHSTHGSSGARLPYSKLKSALDVFRYTDVEMVLYGHLHGLDHMTALFSTVDRRTRKVESVVRHAILTGSYLRYKGSYAEKKNLIPVQMGSPIISLYGEKHDIHVSL